MITTYIVMYSNPTVNQMRNMRLILVDKLAKNETLTIFVMIDFQ
jgi:hypothetical protein